MLGAGGLMIGLGLPIAAAAPREDAQSAVPARLASAIESPFVAHGAGSAMLSATSKPGHRSGGDGDEAETQAAPASQGGVMAAGRPDRTALLDDTSWPDSSVLKSQTVDKIEVRHSAKGVTVADITFEAPPTTANPVRVDVYFGVWNANDYCVSKFELRIVPGSGAQGGMMSGTTWGGDINATVKQSGARVTATSAANGQVAAGNWNCAGAVVGVLDAGTWVVAQNVYSDDLAEASVAVVDIAAPVQGALKGKWLEIRFQVGNRGKGLAKSVSAGLSGKHLTFKKKTISVGDLSDGSTSRALRVKVKLGSKKKTTKLVISVREAGGATAKRTITIVQKPKPKRYKTLVGQYFWGFATTDLNSYSGWDTQTVRFVNKKFVYVGVSKNGKKPRCVKRSKSCVRYKYNPKTGKVKVGKGTFKVTTEGFSGSFGKGDARRYYEPLTLPKRGTRFAANLLNNDWYGNCLLTCTTTTTRLSFDKKGRFVRSGWSIGSWPGLGSSWSVIPPDKRGTYKIVSAGRIELRFANGTKERTTIGFMRDVRGKASPHGVGLALGSTNYYWDD
ncbi:hypothetical protein [Rarobacter faecitabidus]|nr:hypothetical protein [Rarobacter faecitabidus]